MTRLLGSLALIVGGLAWMVQGVLLAGKTYGDTAGVRLLRPTEPLSSTYRNTDDLALYVGAALVLTLVGLALLHGRAIWNAPDRLRRERDGGRGRDRRVPPTRGAP